MDDTVNMTIDGIVVEVPELASKLFQKQEKSLNDQIASLKADLQKFSDQLADMKKAIDGKDGEIAALKKQAEDAKVTPQQIDALVTERQAVVDVCRAVLGDKAPIDGKTNNDLRKLAVAKAYGDQFVQGMSDDAIGGAFRSLSVADPSRPGTTNNTDTLRQNFSRPHSYDPGDAAEKSWKERQERTRNAWKGPQQQQQQKT
jgi:hypothetical protein